MKPVAPVVLCTLWLSLVSQICEALPGGNIRDTGDVAGDSSQIAESKEGKAIGEGEYCPIPRMESINPVWDPEVIYAEREGKLSDFDKKFYKFWKGAFAAGRFGGMKLWGLLASMGDSVLNTLDSLGISKLMEKADQENYYMFNDYEDEFDTYMDETSTDYLEKKKAELAASGSD
ncbi:psiA family protein, putative [Babesia ovata]|uniref:PsiA family protein, putative n=1 Tax=Babesia ovata TaxID=189622 RepID=A0A2H6KI18_9APIC|nr:psiA family protein, putative [Babesia ovata]GBE62619.1 psiA family protein, putative [Babesia ovata]